MVVRLASITIRLLIVADEFLVTLDVVLQNVCESGVPSKYLTNIMCFERSDILSSQYSTTGLLFQRSSKRARVAVFPSRLERCVLHENPSAAEQSVRKHGGKRQALILESKLAGFLLLICISKNIL